MTDEATASPQMFVRNIYKSGTIIIDGKVRYSSMEEARQVNLGRTVKIVGHHIGYA